MNEFAAETREASELFSVREEPASERAHPAVTPIGGFSPVSKVALPSVINYIRERQDAQRHTYCLGVRG